MKGDVTFASTNGASRPILLKVYFNLRFDFRITLDPTRTIQCQVSVRHHIMSGNPYSNFYLKKFGVKEFTVLMFVVCVSTGLTANKGEC